MPCLRFLLLPGYASGSRGLETQLRVDHRNGLLGGELIAQLKEDGLYDNTVIFFWSDHGVGLPRGKRWLYDSGTRVPLSFMYPDPLGSEGRDPRA